MEKIEQKRLNSESINIRSESNGSLTVEGWASVFEQKSRLISEGGKVFYEIINRNAFTEALAREDLNVIANTDHKNANMLARTKSGTLALSVDDYGLKYSFKVPDTTLGRDTSTLLSSGDLNESSFKYTVMASNIVWSRDEDGTLVREIMKVNSIKDVAIVRDGAFGNTDVGLVDRGWEELEESERKELEKTKAEELEKYYSNLRGDFYE